MTYDEVIDFILHFLREIVGDQVAVNASTNLFEVAGLDSISLADLIARLESQVCTIPDEMLRPEFFSTAEGIATAVLSQTRARVPTTSAVGHHGSGQLKDSQRLETSVAQERFIEILRGHLSERLAGSEFDWDASLRGLGLNSMQAVDLVVDLEDALNVAFPDELLHDETFASARTLWDAIQPLLGTAES